MTKLENLCVKWLNDNYIPMEPFIMKEYPNYVFHMKNGQCILQYCKTSGRVYVNYDEIWGFFESFFGMDYKQIQDITKVWVEEQYKMVPTTLTTGSNGRFTKVEEQYKMNVTSAIALHPFIEHRVEEQYKMEVTTTEGYYTLGMSLVEEQYQEIKTNG